MRLGCLRSLFTLAQSPLKPVVLALSLHGTVRGSLHSQNFSEYFWSVIPTSSKLMLFPSKLILHLWVLGILSQTLVPQQVISS